MENFDATGAQRALLSAVNHVYQVEEDGAVETYSDINLPSSTGEVTMGWIEELPEAAAALCQQSGRYNALQMLYYNFRRFQNHGGDIDRWAFLLLVEDWESRDLLFEVAEDDETGILRLPDAVLTRGCAFFEHYFETELNWQEYIPEKELKFSKLINIAEYDDVGMIDATEHKLFHLVRAVRNDVAHHAWLARDYSFDAVLHGARVQIYLLGEFLSRYVEDMGYESDPEWGTIDPVGEYITPVEENYGWEFDSQRKYWKTTELDEHPPL
jgi:hypothetical protein